MSHYSTYIRSCNTNSTVNILSNNNENNENSIKNLLFKHMSKIQNNGLNSHNNNNNNNNNHGMKGTMRGILGEVGNMTLSGKPIISKPKIVQQQQQNIKATIIEPQSKVNLPTSSSSSSITHIENQIEEIFIDDDDDNDDNDEFETSTEMPMEFDCDSGDRLNITTVSEYVADICKYWRDLEQRTPIRQNFLVHRREGTASPQNRAVLIDWLYQVHDRFKLLSDTFHMTVHLIDRYLQMVDVSKHELQLIGSTALLLACKYEEMTIPGMNDFVYVSDNAYSKDDMKEMERRIISALSYDLGRPLSINYLRRYSKLIQATDIEHTLGKYLLDLTFTDHTFSHMAPSYIAACASFLSRYLLSYKRITSSTSIELLCENLWPNKFMFYYTGYRFAQLRQGIEQLGQLLIGQETTKLRSVLKKFSQSNLFSIAQHSCCKSANVQTALSRLFQ